LRASSTRLTAARQSTRLETPFNRHASTLANVDEPTGHTGELARRFTPVRRPTLLSHSPRFFPWKPGRRARHATSIFARVHRVRSRISRARRRILSTRSVGLVYGSW